MRSGGAAHKSKAPPYKMGEAHCFDLLPLEGGGPRQRWRLAEAEGRRSDGSRTHCTLLLGEMSQKEKSAGGPRIADSGELPPKESAPYPLSPIPYPLGALPLTTDYRPLTTYLTRKKFPKNPIDIFLWDSIIISTTKERVARIGIYIAWHFRELAAGASQQEGQYRLTREFQR